MSSKFSYLYLIFQKCPDGGTGRHVALKMLWPLWPCGFDPRSGYYENRNR